MMSDGALMLTHVPFVFMHVCAMIVLQCSSSIKDQTREQRLPSSMKSGSQKYKEKLCKFLKNPSQL